MAFSIGVQSPFNIGVFKIHRRTDVVSPLENRIIDLLVLNFKYYLKYKAQSEAKSLVSGLEVTKNREPFTT